MDNNEIKTNLHSFLTTEFPNEGVELKDTTDLLQEWFIDSLGIINMIMFLESEFNISVARSEINGDNFKDLNTLSAYINSKLN